MKPQRLDEFTPEQLAQLNARWRSDIEKELAEIRAIVIRLDEVFQQAQGALVLIKWGGALIAALAAAAVWVSQHFNWKG